jgi:hypothetical protein
MKGNELRIWPEEEIRIRSDEGVVWTPILLGDPVGDFTIQFPQGSPFEGDEFDQEHRYSGPVRRAGKRFPYHIVRAGKTSPQCFVEVVTPQTAPGVVPKRIKVSNKGNKTAVDCLSMPIWKDIDQVEWYSDSSATITVAFANSPFADPLLPGTGSVRSSRAIAKGEFKYTITLSGFSPLDPEVVVDPPGGGGGSGG